MEERLFVVKDVPLSTLIQSGTLVESALSFGEDRKIPDSGMFRKKLLLLYEVEDALEKGAFEKLCRMIRQFLLGDQERQVILYVEDIALDIVAAAFRKALPEFHVKDRR